ncbi:MAG: cold shock domain-containing protein [Cytophagaceae bacterium]|jgi:CspA family cold shock protein|nr:cold shock domain-containing protein [Cytophagaceae bacterium]
MHTGVIKFFNESKGFGFIKEDGTDREVFVHVTGLKEKVRQNDRVSFNVKDGKKGLNAVDVKKIA